MFAAVSKARNLARQGGGGLHRSAYTPGVFKPPFSGTGYYSQFTRFEQVLHYRHWAFVAINAWIKEIAGGEPPSIGRLSRKPEDADPKKRRLGNAVKKVLGGPKAHQEFTPYDDDHPLCRLFSNPNGPDVAYDLWAYHVLFKKLTGESHWWVLRNDFDVPVEIWIIPTHWKRLAVGDDGQPLGYHIQNPWGQYQFAPYDEVVSFYEHNPLSRYEGAPVTQAVAEWLDSYDSMIRMRLAVWKNGAVPNLHVKLGESYADPDEQFLARFYSKWFGRFQGENNSGLPLVTGSDVEVKGVDGHRPADALAATNQSEEHIRDAVLAAYQVPKAIVGLTDSMTYGSVLAEQDAFRTFAVNAELAYTGQVISEKIIRRTPGCKDGTCFFADRRTGDPAFLLQKQRQNWDLGVSSSNEIRVENGLEPWPLGGDNPFVAGQEMPWMTEQTSEGNAEGGAGLEAAFNRAMGGGGLSESSGSSGGYLTEGKNRLAATNGRSVNGVAH